MGSIKEIQNLILNQGYHANFSLDIDNPLYLNVILYKARVKNKNFYVNYISKSTASKFNISSYGINILYLKVRKSKFRLSLANKLLRSI